MKFDIFHFVQDDSHLDIYLGGVGWRRRSRQPTPPKTKFLVISSFNPNKMGHNEDMTGIVV
jgi:hypothetical protein